MSFNTIIDWNSCTAEQQRQLLMRPAISASESITRTVNDILDNVKARGDDALREYSAKFDKTTVTALKVSAEEIAAASERLSDELKQAMAVAVKNIETFHTAQKLPPVDVETQPGVRCQQVTRPVASVGLYIPGGSAPLFSTVLMLATPARIAGCKKVVLCSPPPIADEILYAAQLCGVQDVFNVGGAQAIAALAFGTESVPKVDKIFGPGNAFVTEAKRQVSQRLDGAAIDMPAGPSEVLVIADSGATPDFVASDLLSQAEHGPDSQVILLTPAADMARRVAEAVERQLAELPRAETARQALSASRLIVTKDLAQCVEISNQYGPEHLIIQTRNARELVDGITSAGSVFLGDWSPESAGDYASGTNHVLPTYGYTATLLDDAERSMFALQTAQDVLGIDIVHYFAHYYRTSTARWEETALATPPAAPQVTFKDPSEWQWSCASIEEYDSHLERLSDQNAGSAWRPEYGTSASTYEIILDTRSSEVVNGVCVTQVHDIMLYDYTIMPTTIQVQASNDRSTWENITYVEDNELGNMAGEQNFLYFTEPRAVRYLRFRINTLPTSSSGNNYGVILGEISLF